jgi:hypothetical protein
MSDNDSPNYDAWELVHGFVTRSREGELSEAEIEDFEILLRDDAKIRQIYTQHIELTGLMERLLDHREEAVSRPPGFESVLSAASHDVTAANSMGPTDGAPVLGFLASADKHGWRFLSRRGVLFALALSILVGLALGFWGKRPVAKNPANKDDVAGQSTPPKVSGANSPALGRGPKGRDPNAPTIARLTRVIDCRWSNNDNIPQTGDSLPAARALELDAGVIELNFNVGVRAVVQGPACFELLSDRKIALRSGKFTAEILRPEARGFEVVTPKGTVVDLGTEFAIVVTPSNDVNVHVFKGEVVVEKATDIAASVAHHLVVGNGLRMEGNDEPLLVADTGETFVRTMEGADRDRHVVAYWRFEDCPTGAPAPHSLGNRNRIRATLDSSYNGNDLFAYSVYEQPSFSNDVPAAAVPTTGRADHSSLDTTLLSPEEGQCRNVYTHSVFCHAAPLDVQKITPAQWTIEASVKMADHTGKAQGFLGRDGSFTEEQIKEPPRFSFVVNPGDRFSVAFCDLDGRRHEAVAKDLPVKPGQWYHVAAVSDGAVLRLFVDALDGKGYMQRAALNLPKTGATALGKGKDNAEWTVGRVGNVGKSAEWLWFRGFIDEVRICDIALQPTEFLFAKREGIKEVADVAKKANEKKMAKR